MENGPNRRLESILGHLDTGSTSHFDPFSLQNLLDDTNNHENRKKLKNFTKNKDLFKPQYNISIHKERELAMLRSFKLKLPSIQRT